MTTASARLNKQRAKQDERDIAKLIGGRRHPADTGGLEDVEHPYLSVQVKGGGRVVTEIMREGLAAAKASAVGKNKLPCVVLVDRRGTRLQRWIAFDLADYCAWEGLGNGTSD